MKKNKLNFILLIVILCLAATVDAQVASNKQVSRDSLMNYLNTLLKDNSISAREQLLKEAAVLRKGNSEDDMALAMKIYNVADDSTNANELEQQILKKYPNGLIARDEAYAKIFNGNAGIFQKETAYNNWIKQFPPKNFSAQQQGKYNFALLGLIQGFSKRSDASKADAYLKLLVDSSMRTVALYDAGKEFFNQGDIHKAKSYLAEALLLSSSERNATDMATRSSFGAMFYENIVSIYGELLLKQQSPDSAIILLQPLIRDNQFSGMNAQAFTLIMARALEMKGKKQEAFSLLNDFLTRNAGAEEGLKIMKPLYLSLNPQAEFSTYLDQLRELQNKYLQKKLSKEMIRKKAFEFSLIDMDGNRVNLPDYKGKVVIIDFWATWCAPCLKSFPDMKQLINRYKDNQKVAFLFINTWENNPDYKAKVKSVIQQNSYPFKVLYDDKEQGTPPELVAKKFDIASLPAKFILDEDGDIRFRIDGTKNDGKSEEEILSAMIDLLLSQKGN